MIFAITIASKTLWTASGGRPCCLSVRRAINSVAVAQVGDSKKTEMEKISHVSRVAQTCFYHLHRIHVRSVRRQLGRDVTARLVTALVLSRLDYCSAELAGLPASTLAPFQRVLHVAARTVLDLKPCDRVTPALRELHWLPVVERIQYKLCGSQVASGTHTGIYLTFWHRLPIFQVDLHCALHRVATSSCRELATEPFLLLHRREHGTGYRRS